MRIAGEFKAQEWETLRTRLVAGEQAAWHEAVKLLDDRIRGRYLDHARRLLDEHYSGFAVLALDSAVIEALEQFRRGEPKTPNRKSGTFFKTFLTQTRFKAHFTSEEKAGLFFDTIRCGILHQAEAKEDSLVKKSTAHPVASTLEKRCRPRHQCTTLSRGAGGRVRGLHEEPHRRDAEQGARGLSGSLHPEDGCNCQTVSRRGRIRRSLSQTPPHDPANGRLTRA